MKIHADDLSEWTSYQYLDIIVLTSCIFTKEKNNTLREIEASRDRHLHDKWFTMQNVK